MALGSVRQKSMMVVPADCHAAEKTAVYLVKQPRSHIQQKKQDSDADFVSANKHLLIHLHSAT